MLENQYNALVASHAAYSPGKIGVGFNFLLDATYSETGFIIDNHTGFKSIAYINESSREAIVAFAGTDDLKDVYANLSALGGHNGECNRAAVLEYLNRPGSRVDNITLTGHSLGGALAQYAAQESDCYFFDTLALIRRFRSRSSL